MATETRMGHFGGTATSTVDLEIIGAHDTGWSDYKIYECSFLATSACTLTINGVDEITLLANVALNFGESDKITSIEIAEADVVYQLACRVLGTYTA